MNTLSHLPYWSVSLLLRYHSCRKEKLFYRLMELRMQPENSFTSGRYLVRFFEEELNRETCLLEQLDREIQRRNPATVE